jgi:hypothetical protein
MSVSQLVPVKPVAHAQVYTANATRPLDGCTDDDESVHVEPFMHGTDAHSFVSYWQ